jgi:hypothetical protein
LTGRKQMFASQNPEGKSDVDDAQSCEVKHLTDPCHSSSIPLTVVSDDGVSSLTSDCKGGRADRKGTDN